MWQKKEINTARTWKSYQPLTCQSRINTGPANAWNRGSAHLSCWAALPLRFPLASRTLKHGLQNARECARRQVGGTHAECVVRGSIAQATLSARVAIVRSGEWAALSVHLPRTCLAFPRQYNCSSMHMGNTEPQSLNTLRVEALPFPHQYVNTPIVSTILWVAYC